MGWNGYEHMFGGWWFMPFFGIIFMIVFLYLIYRIISGDRHNANYPPQGDMDELRREIHALNAEIKELKESLKDKK